MLEMDPNNFLDLSVQEVSDLLCEQLQENRKDGKCYAGAVCLGTNKIDGKRVHLSIILSENLLNEEDLL